MTMDLNDLSSVLRLAPDMLAEVVDQKAAVADLRSRIKSDDAAYDVFTRAAHFERDFAGSWLYGPGENSPYLVFEVAASALADHRYRTLLAGIVLSRSAAVPYDYRALAADELHRISPGEYTDALQTAVDSYEPLPQRDRDAKLSVPTDGIDHLFPIPDTVSGRIKILTAASAAKTLESRFLLARRLLGLDEQSREPKSEAERLITTDVRSTMVAADDYLVPWDQEFRFPDGLNLTLAELVRIVMMCPEFGLPDTTIRPVLVDFYRSVLRVSGRAIIGLSAAVFHVEHGTLATPSYYYQGRDAILGKGCVIDCVGGAILQGGSFLGGGYMPILIHTHKHIRNKGESGASERKKVLPCVFVAESGARFPMHAIGLFETVDYLDKETPYEGIRGMRVDSAIIA